MKDFLSIKEFSRMAKIEQTTLRYWNDIGVVAPAKRSEENNYRYYSPEQIIGVNFVSVLSSLGVPLKQIGEVQSARSPEKILNLISQQERLIDLELSRLRQCYSVIHTRRKLITLGLHALNGFAAKDGTAVNWGEGTDEMLIMDPSGIALINMDAWGYIMGPRNDWTDVEEFYVPFMHFCEEADDLRINLNFSIGAVHDDWAGFAANPGKPDNFISLDPIGNKKKKAGKYVIGFVHGYYGQFGTLADSMEVFIKKHGLEVEGPAYTIYLLDEICQEDPDDYLAMVCVAVA
jgi:DNA-binding transcriptional MerR regulator